ncbi:MAG: hypothetical protein PHE17_12040 [Thiothrix sp.]|uniref:hypothetical protein n=1 Tax=Thiothrix sp. TaxID=1032 RepID=UPI0026030CE2|nr:hypothetical protein [Thiothrix sp.]MDD5393740.1 hypothetical protein [Thiothrix sp.]
MMKASLTLFKRKPSQTKTKQAATLTVGLDVFGNAIPVAPSAQVEGSSKSLRVVKQQEIALKPSRKSRAKTAKSSKAGSKQTALVPVAPSLLGRLLPSWGKSAEQNVTKVVKVSPMRPPAKRDNLHTDGVAERLEYAFKRLHHEFNEREHQLELKMQALAQHHHLLQGTTQKKRLWLVPLALTGMAAGGYMLYVLTSMQGSMTAMSGNINTMNTHMGTMAGDTQVMTQNIQTMNESMYYMNNNVAYMSGNVAQMNQKVGTLAQAAAPMGEAASAVSPFTKMFKSFMPF